MCVIFSYYLIHSFFGMYNLIIYLNLIDLIVLDIIFCFFWISILILLVKCKSF